MSQCAAYGELDRMRTAHVQHTSDTINIGSNANTDTITANTVTYETIPIVL